ncbi:hypothetical protein THASP1DRAFT_31833 [Thamnocephalis sphaerospora]|uniref:RWD domain-containing protein n=1 Tax=Thamnocephalis sphaerospora TaxID=78915 RepID=A0A4P9XKK9_9FUNG|nr:hypothetical protein THASP1DRAFT_31833 [Thamnocephalis sphaerospora]|eukprot:RKP06343.1 hypothetical protein THASP1DRAFT_31833 [Thamnocephalis sphaerospora]
MSMAPSTRDVVLASRHGLYVIDLEAPLEPACYLRFESSWDPVEVRWNPHRARENWVATTSNRRILVWNVQASPDDPVETVLRGHERAVSDLHWSPYQPNMIASGALDTDIHLWDLRTPQRSAISFCAWTAGAARVQYNRKNEFMLASAHANIVKIWDTRKGTTPTTEIKAHGSKVNYVDWSLEEENEMLTGGQDHTIRFWDIREPTQCRGVIATQAPIRLARYAPFGPAVLSASQRLDSTMRLWSRDNHNQPVRVFEGSTAPFRKFGWRIRNDTDDCFQLVGLSLDGHLRAYHVDAKVVKASGKQGKFVIAKQRPTHSLKQLHSATVSNHDTTRVPAVPLEAPIHVLGTTATSGHPSQLFNTRNTTSGTVVSPTLFLPGSLPRNDNLAQRRGIPPLPSEVIVGPTRTRGQLFVDTGVAAADALSIFLSSSRSQANLSNPPTSSSLSSSMTSRRTAPKVTQHDDGRSSMSISAALKSADNPRYPPLSEGILAEEFAAVKRRYPQVQYNKLDPLTRTCSLSLDGPWMSAGQALVNLSIIFPNEYPAAAPNVSVHRSAAIPMMNRAHMIKGLSQVITAHLDRRQPCLEAIVAFLLGEHMRTSSHAQPERDDDAVLIDQPRGQFARSMHTQDRSRVPFPRLCGASFTATGRLMIFFTKKAPPIYNGSRTGSRKDFSFAHASRRSTRPELNLRDIATIETATSLNTSGWPRSYDRYDHTMRPTRRDGQRLRTVPSYEEVNEVEDTLGLSQPARIEKKTRGSPASSSSMRASRFPVRLMDVRTHIPISYHLAALYTLHGDHPAEIALKNAQVAKTNGRSDLHSLWTLASLILDDSMRKPNASGSATVRSYADELYPMRIRWGLHPFGRQMVQSLLDYLARIGDVQTLAMLCCVFSEPFPPYRRLAVLTGAGRPTSISPSATSDYFGIPSKQQLLTTSTLSSGPSAPAEALKTATTATFPYFPSFGLRSSHSDRGRERNSIAMMPSSFPERSGQDPLTMTFAQMGMPTRTSSGPFTTASGGALARAGDTVSTASFSTAMPHTARQHPAKPASPPPSGNLPTSGAATVAGFFDSMVNSQSVPDIPAAIKPSSEFKVVMLHEERDFDSEIRPRNVSLLDPSRWVQYDHHRMYYAELLFRWGLLDKRAEVLKFATSSATWQANVADFDEKHHLAFGIYCSECNTALGSSGRCEKCRRRRAGIKCALCHITVRGLANVCLACQHGGHSQHMRDWFAQGNTECPAGCGCACVQACGEFK